jgi:hypothetical protein
MPLLLPDRFLARNLLFGNPDNFDPWNVFEK